MDYKLEHQKLMEKTSTNMSAIRHKIAVMSGKGGVGKTTVAVNLAYALSGKYKVGILDADITGPNVPKMVGLEDTKLLSGPSGIQPKEKSKVKIMSIAFLLEDRDTPVIWRGPLRGNIILQLLSEVVWQQLDYLIIDLPPGTGDEALSVAELIPELDGVVIVTTPQDVALLDARKSVNFARKLNLPVLGIVENMAGLSCPHCGKQINLFGVGGGEKAAAELKIPFLGRIPFHQKIVTASDNGKPFAVENRKSKGLIEFQKIVHSIEESIKTRYGK